MVREALNHREGDVVAGQPLGEVREGREAHLDRDASAHLGVLAAPVTVRQRDRHRVRYGPDTGLVLARLAVADVARADHSLERELRGR